MEVKELKKSIKETCIEDANQAFLKLKEIINNDSPIYNRLLLLFSQFKDLQKVYLSNLVSRENRNIEHNRIQYGLLNIIDEIKLEDINEEPQNLTSSYNLDNTKGIFDYFDTIVELRDNTLIKRSQITSAMRSYGKKMSLLENEMDSLKNMPTGVEKINLHRIYDKRMSELLQEFSNAVREKIIQFEELHRNFIDANMGFVEKLIKQNLIGEYRDLMIAIHSNLKVRMKAREKAKAARIEEKYARSTLKTYSYASTKAKNELAKLLDSFYEANLYKEEEEKQLTFNLSQIIKEELRK